MFQVTILDDAGKRVPLVLYNATLLPFATGPLPADVQRTLRDAVTAESWRPRVFLSRQAFLRAWVGAIPPIILFGAYAAVRFSGMLNLLGPNGWLIIPLGFPVVFIFMAFFMCKVIPLGLTDRARMLSAKTAAFKGYCGSCGYILPEISDTRDQLCHCSECGAAWARSDPSRKTSVK